MLRSQTQTSELWVRHANRKGRVQLGDKQLIEKIDKFCRLFLAVKKHFYMLHYATQVLACVLSGIDGGGKKKCWRQARAVLSGCGKGSLPQAVFTTRVYFISSLAANDINSS